MIKIKNDESGFGVIEIIIALVIVVLIVTVVWLIYKRHTERSTKNNFNSSQCPPGQVSQYSTIPNSKAYKCVSSKEHLVF
jgi:Tfp pilus assembly protein PilV